MALAATLGAVGSLLGGASGLFGGGGGGGGDSLSDSGHLITTISDNNFSAGPINFSPKFTALFVPLGISALIIYFATRE